jgi:hypothetical protein
MIVRPTRVFVIIVITRLVVVASALRVWRAAQCPI